LSDSRVRALVADDEPLARSGLRRMLAEIDWIECVGEAASGSAAVEAIDRLAPDLIFLDIEMPDGSGIDVLRRVSRRPFVVFTTAYAEHAVTAFELGALDYLLKPFGEERLATALARIRAALGDPRDAIAERLAETMGRGPMTRIFVRLGRSILPVAVDDVAWLEAEGDYVAVNTCGVRHLLHVSLSQLEMRLDPGRFTRIHRTHIVNLDHVAAFRREPGGQLAAEMKDGTRLAVSRARAKELRSLAR
jgi:two-component system LytT family response regulator